MIIISLMMKLITLVLMLSNPMMIMWIQMIFLDQVTSSHVRVIYLVRMLSTKIKDGNLGIIMRVKKWNNDLFICNSIYIIFDI